MTEAKTLEYADAAEFSLDTRGKRIVCINSETGERTWYWAYYRKGDKTGWYNREPRTNTGMRDRFWETPAVINVYLVETYPLTEDPDTYIPPALVPDPDGLAVAAADIVGLVSDYTRWVEPDPDGELLIPPPPPGLEEEDYL